MPPTSRRPHSAWALRLVFLAFMVALILVLCRRHLPISSGSTPSKKDITRDPPLPRWHKVVSYPQWRKELFPLLRQPRPHYVLFTANYKPGTETPWCRDCAKVLPIVRKLIGQIKGSLLEVQIGEKDEWHDMHHPLRQDSDVMLRFIPTLIYWDPETFRPLPGTKLEDPLSATKSSHELAVVLAEYVQKTAYDEDVTAITSKIIKNRGKGCGLC